MEPIKVSQACSEIEGLIEEKLSAPPGTLKQNLSKLRRKLPYRFRAHADFLVDAEHQLRHPKRRVLVNKQKVEAARSKLASALGDYDKSRIRSRAVTMTIGIIVINLMIFGGMLYGLLIWLGVI